MPIEEQTRHHRKSACTLLDCTADIVTSYVGHNNVPPKDLPDLIRLVQRSLGGLANPHIDSTISNVPAIAPSKSVTADYIICLEDGKCFKSLKRHLRTSFNLSPDQYRQKWGLGEPYPMVAPGYSKKRSAIAKATRLDFRPRTDQNNI
ncbi:MucR family transcriptional regulator [Brucella pituitosa]|uniref:MucR family transcriptional regulator n=1 Tax=Brucella pituitosa TaxID=571256 RepID=UPI0031F4211F